MSGQQAPGQSVQVEQFVEMGQLQQVPYSSMAAGEGNRGCVVTGILSQHQQHTQGGAVQLLGFTQIDRETGRRWVS